MKCPSCGREAREGSRFCPGCGNKLGPALEEKAAAKEGDVPQTLTGRELPQEPGVEETPDRERAGESSVSNGTRSHVGEEGEKQPGRKKAKRWRIVVVALVIVALLFSGIGVYFIWFRDGEEEASEKERPGVSREYDVKIEMPEGTPLELSQTKLTYGIDGETQISDIEGNRADAKVLMNDGATGLITLQDKNTGEDILLAVFPKNSDYLKDYVPVVNAESTAQALVFMQFGIADSNPIIARITLELIKQLPETRQLAGYIAEKSTEEPALIYAEDETLGQHVAAAYVAFIDYMELLNSEISAAVQRENEFVAYTSPQCKGMSRIEGPSGVYPNIRLEDTDLQTSAGVDVRLELDESTMTGKFRFTNRCNWPGAAFIYKDGDDSSFDGDSFLGLIPPVPFQPNTVTETVMNLIKMANPVGQAKLIYDTIQALIKGNLDDLATEIKTALWGDIYKSEVRFDIEHRFDDYGQYRLEIFVPGYNDITYLDEAFASKDMRVYLPFIVKVIDEAWEVISIGLDFAALPIDVRYPRFTESRQLLIDLALKVGAELLKDLDEIVWKLYQEDYWGALKHLFDAMGKLIKEPKFWEFLSRHYFLGKFPDLVTRQSADQAIKALRKTFAKALLALAIADIAAKLLGLGCRFYLWVVQGELYGPRDEFRFELIAPGKSPPSVAAGTDTAFVIDVSGSMGDGMEGADKMFHARTVANELVGTIRNESLTGGIAHAVGLVTFSDDASIVSSLTSNYTAVESAIGGLAPQSMTNIEDGINKGIAVLGSARAGSSKIMVLLSDGLPNRGASSLDALLAGCVEEARRGGIVINTVGFGSDADETLLRAIADHTGGTYAYAADAFALSSVYVKLRHEAMGKVVYSEEDTISAAVGTKRKTFEVAEGVGEINGTVNWRGVSALDFRIYDPRGRMVDASYPGASLFKDRNPMQFMVKNPLKGTWVLEVVVSGSSAVPRGFVLAGSRIGNNGAYAAIAYASEGEGTYGGGEEAEFQVVVSTRGEKEEPTTYPLVLWIVFGSAAFLALALFLLFNRRISPALGRERVPVSPSGDGG